MAFNKKQHVVFMMGSYHFQPSAVGVCGGRIVELFKDDFAVSVISFGSHESVPNCEHGNCNYYGVESEQMKLFKKYSQDASSSFFGKLQFNTYRLIKAFSFLFKTESVDRDLVHAYSSMLSEINSKKKIDVVIPLCFPFESLLAAYDFKNKNRNVVMVPYLFDNFALSASLHKQSLIRRIRKNTHLRLESKVFNSSDAVIAMHALEDYLLHYHGNSRSNVLFSEHPLLIPSIGKDRSSRNGAICLAYAGGVFKRVREPEYMLSTLVALDRTLDISCQIYAFGSATNVVNDFSKRHCFIKSHGHVPPSVVQDAYADAHILINLGEIEGKQVSSKVFEYISLGKPIIHFEYINTCVVTKLLERYPLAFVVNVNNCVNDCIDDITDFINKNKFERLTFGQVSKIYPDAIPKFTADIIKNVIEQKNEKSFN
jgi:hypothetical protein